MDRKNKNKPNFNSFVLKYVDWIRIPDNNAAPDVNA